MYTSAMIIGFDLDDVLLNFHDSLREFCNIQYNRNHRREEVVSYFIEDTFGFSREEGGRMVFGFYNDSCHQDIPPIEGALDGIARLKENHSLVIVTARPESTEEKTKQLISRYFPDTFREVHFTNHFFGSTNRRLKSELCRQLGIEIFIDDSINNARDIAEIGVPVLLLDAPWNRNQDLPPGVTRVYSWEEIIEKIDG